MGEGEGAGVLVGWEEEEGNFMNTVTKERVWEHSIEPKEAAIRQGQRAIESATGHGQAVFILRSGGGIDLRDNSGQEGLCGEEVYQATVKLLDLLFPKASLSPAAAGQPGDEAGQPCAGAGTNWRSNAVVMYGPEGWWVRYTCPHHLYWWLNPTTRKWVGEPDQMRMPLFPSCIDARAALEAAPIPPNTTP